MSMWYRTRIEILGLTLNQAAAITARGKDFLGSIIPLPKTIKLDENGFYKTEKDKESAREFYDKERDCRFINCDWKYTVYPEYGGYRVLIEAQTEDIPKKEILKFIKEFEMEKEWQCIEFLVTSFWEEFDEGSDNWILRAEIISDEKQKLTMTEYAVKTPLTYVI